MTASALSVKSMQSANLGDKIHAGIIMMSIIMICQLQMPDR